MESNHFKVIIVGGSISGLSLALMLEKNGIDFIVLEGYKSIAPQVGASIGVLSNGLRILDQLDCCQPVLDAAEYPVDEVFYRDSRGKLIWSLEDYVKDMSERHGYPAVFLDRRMLIEILYDKIKDKTKVLTSQRVQTIDNNDSGVTVHTLAGQKFTGSIVIGADGIHSTVRQEMWKEAQRLDPKWLDPSEKSALPATYACIFGISEGDNGPKKGTLTSVVNEHFSYLIPSGPGKRTYWFLVHNMGQTFYGSDIPRFTKEEEEALAKEHWDDQLTPTLRFSDLYTSKIASVYTTLPEYVYKRWHFQRIMTVGDASHKFEPLTGQGGNNAIETSASLTNHLVAALRGSKTGTLSTEEISNIFKRVQEQREERVSGLIKASHTRQRLECMETPLLKFLASQVLPYVPKSILLRRWIPVYSAGVSLNMLPMPRKPRDVAYFDERFRVPSSRGIFGIILYAAFFFLAWAGRRQLWTAGKVNGTWSLVREAVLAQTISLPGGVKVPLRQVYTGLQPIDRILQSLVTVFLPAVSNSSAPEQALQSLYFLATMLPIIAILTVEGYRPRNRWTLLASPALWGVLYQLRGIGLIAPIYFAMSIFHSASVGYFTPTSRTIPVSVAQALLPALVLGFVLPTMMMFFPLQDTLSSRQVFIALWQPAPIYVALLTDIVSRGIKWLGRSAPVRLDDQFGTSVCGDIPYLRIVYAAVGGISACFHFALILSWIASGSGFITRALIPLDSFGQVSSLADGIFIFFQNDFLLVAIATMLWCLTSIWDMYRMGISNVSWQVGCVGLVLACTAVGPGATAAAVWYWREKTLSRTSFGQHPSAST
ncbi:unnamed protein product [Penicillium salamii]|uniref:FAD-binding domain-containing protein n=1 Tax=Penicillium salamii TaxID=1612424 RepID=A0A9W4JF97_9EURO|nr:unnamed protein product [Penicillium salamii]CAG8108292.1 unnamed protein product [Penicillium salamii]CAG8312996.1 unnamed protein product [Penicillium salamii]CAG8359951.1 unnamed protein product [Penicillium salamii]CAG8385964.1 unnamed protein product [Penicillium salamii]